MGHHFIFFLCRLVSFLYASLLYYAWSGHQFTCLFCWILSFLYDGCAIIGSGGATIFETLSYFNRDFAIILQLFKLWFWIFNCTGILNLFELSRIFTIYQSGKCTYCIFATLVKMILPPFGAYFNLLEGEFWKKNHLPMWQTVKHYVKKIYIIYIFLRNVWQFATLVNGFFFQKSPSSKL